MFRSRRLLAAPALVAVAGTVALATSGGAPAADLSADRAKAVDWAVSQVGHRERGTTNCSAKIIRWEKDMGLKVPPCREWCGAFVHQAFLRQGIRLSARLIDPHRSYFDAVAERRGLKRISKSSVREGDLLFFRFRPKLKASHIAIVRSAPKNGKVELVEGNVGHEVTLETRSLKFAVLAARVTG